MTDTSTDTGTDTGTATDFSDENVSGTRPHETGEAGVESLEAVRDAAAARTADRHTDDVEADDEDTFELPGAELEGEDFVLDVLPQQADEFMCSSCFLVKHQAQRSGGSSVCRDCD